MKISIVIPNYNGKENLVKNLPSVLETGADEVIVVDDASSDESVNFIKTQPVKLLINENNLGFSSTVNRGVKEASGDIVILLGTDVSPDNNFLESLMSNFSDENVFGVGCLNKSIEKGQVVLRGRGIGSWQRGFLVHQRGEVDKNDTLWVDMGSGAFKKYLWDKLGGLDPLYNPFYWEDIDLSFRAQKSGYKILFESKSQVTHKHEEGVIKKQFSQFNINSIAYRNQFFFVWKNITYSKYLISHLLWLPYHFVSTFLRGDLAFFYGFLLAIIKLPKLMASRKQASKLFSKKDEEILHS